MQHALAILTYANSVETDRRLYCMLDSLRESAYSGTVFVVDDGSSNRDWSILEKYDVSLVCRQSNGGVSRGKNTSIRVLLDHGVDVGFLADDDLVFQPEWWQGYLDAHERTDIQHFSWANDRKGFETVEYQDYAVKKTGFLNGCLLTFTPQVISKIGGFEVREPKWGWDHVNWSHRIISQGLSPFYVDVVGSNQKVHINKWGTHSTVSMVQRREIRHYNYPRIEKVYRPLEE